MQEFAQAQSAGRGAGQINRLQPPSLEQRLDHLQRGVERLSKMRYVLATVADRVSLESDGKTDGCATPPSSDLSGRFGETIGYLHTHIDDIERIVQRLEASLFDQKPAAVPTR